MIFLADRWFNSKAVLDYIDSLGHTYCIRLKGNLSVKVFDQKEGHYLIKHTDDLFAYQHHSVYYQDAFLYNDFSLKANITVGKRQGFDEPWMIATNSNPNKALRDYSYRFGSIEAIFKNQKSNGFFIEAINNANIKSFTCHFSLVCFLSSLSYYSRS